MFTRYNSTSPPSIGVAPSVPPSQALSDLVKDTLEITQKALRKEKAAGNAAMIDDAVSKMSENERAKVQTKLESSRVAASYPLLFVRRRSALSLALFSHRLARVM